VRVFGGFSLLDFFLLSFALINPFGKLIYQLALHKIMFINYKLLLMFPDLTGKVALVGGATSGIGKGIAYVLAALKADVAVVARNEQLGNDVVSDLRKINPNGTYEMLLCDASSMKSIKECSEQFNSKFDKLNYCVMSQGIATMEGRNETKEGIDTKMALHYYGRVNFIQQLAPVLKRTAETEDVRVVSVLSGGVHSAYGNLNDIPLKTSYSLANAANAAGFYNDLAFDQLSRDFSGPNGDRISFIHTAPGFIKTAWGKDFPAPLRAIVRLVQLFGRDPEDYARQFVQTALLSEEFGAPHVAAPPGGEVCVGGTHAAGFHLMSAGGGVAKATSLHNDQYRNAVWKHTQEAIAAALAK
jgi:NAD(P)-dependent dehydrogenase (short-subunit alcohol dehydrogenase family)